VTTDLHRHYDDAFYSTFRDKSRLSAAIVVPIVNQIVRPASVLDVGCGMGGWLSAWAEQGVTDVLGLDGPHVDAAVVETGQATFQAVDLRIPFSLGRKFDLVQSLEVAEHLDETFADQFVRSLTRHGDTVLFSAAIPGQGGFHHVNEQWPSYWIDRFANEGYRVFDVLRPAIWANAHVEFWYRQNILLFSRVLDLPTTNTCVDLVHPELWQQRREPAPASLRQLLAALPGAVAAAGRWRLRRTTKRIRRATHRT
jgi:SAM-dependent methyltransferase